MMMNVSLPLFLLLNLLFSSSHAFVLNRPSSLRVLARSNAATPTTARSGLRQQSKTLLQMSFDPNTIFDSMISTTGSILLSEELGSAVGDGEGAISYSRASYYTILALYLISLPGLWSTIQRTTKVKIQKKTYLSPGAQSADGRSLRQEAAEIMAYMKANNYIVKDAGETITFEGIVQRSLSQAFFLAFVTALGMASLALVLQIQFNDLELCLPVIGKPNWYYLTLVSPYAGIYYWKKGDRVDQCSVKLQTNEEETENEIVVQGSEEELDRMWRTLGWREKGMVKVEGLLKQYQ